MNSIDRKPGADQLLYASDRSQPDGTGQISLQQRCMEARGNEVKRSHDHDLVRRAVGTLTGDPQVMDPERVAVRDYAGRFVPHRRKREKDRLDQNVPMAAMQPFATPQHVVTVKNRGRYLGERGRDQARMSLVGRSVHDERAVAAKRGGPDRIRPVAVAASSSVPMPHAVEINQPSYSAGDLGDDRSASKGGVKPEGAREPLDVRANHALTHADTSPVHSLSGRQPRSAAEQHAAVRSPVPKAVSNHHGKPSQFYPVGNLSDDHSVSKEGIKAEGARAPLDVRADHALTHADTSPVHPLSDRQVHSAAGQHADVRSPVPKAVPNDHGKPSQPFPVDDLGHDLLASKGGIKPKGTREPLDVRANHVLTHAGTPLVHPLSGNQLRSAAEQHADVRSHVPKDHGKPSQLNDEAPAAMRSSSTATRTIHYNFKTWVGQPGVDVRSNLESPMRSFTVSTSDDAVAQVLESRADELSAPVVKVRRDGDDEEPSRRRRVQLLQEEE
ncbi:hypothetical protein ACJ51O_37095 (plasmid) [Burkholderia pyrrocinia]|uniref:SpaN/EivJ family type III secretion system needle length determinant n=1 Tax=Burkholderia pyrrocinia TaxID=60550 RepID=UPI0038B42956